MAKITGDMVDYLHLNYGMQKRNSESKMGEWEKQRLSIKEKQNRQKFCQGLVRML